MTAVSTQGQVTDDLGDLTESQLDELEEKVGAVAQQKIQVERERRRREKIQEAYDQPANLELEGEGFSAFDKIPDDPDVMYFEAIPVSKNAIRTPARNHDTGGLMIVRTQEARDWEKYARNAAGRMWSRPPINGPVAVHKWVIFADRRRRDLANVDELLLDSLEGVCYEDDSQVYELHGFKAVRPERDEHAMYVKVQPIGGSDG